MGDDGDQLKKKDIVEIPKIERQRVLPRTLFFSRTQPKYDLFSNTLLRRWVDRPLFFDRRTAASDKPYGIVNCASFLKTEGLLRSYGLDGLGSLLASIPQQGAAFLEMLDCLEAHQGQNVPLVMEVSGATTAEAAARRIGKFLPLARRALQSSDVFRVNDKVLVLSYALDGEPLEHWTVFQKTVKETLGNKFLFVVDVTTKRPALLREFQELGGVSEQTLEGFRQHLRDWLDVSDGIMWAGGSHTNREDGTLDRAFYRDFLVPVFNGVLAEPAYRQKLLGLDAEVGYINVMTSRTVNSEEGTSRLRDNFEIALEASADFVVMPEWDELNENTSIGPTLTNSLSTQRIVRYFVHKFANEPSQPLLGDDVEVPNLVVSFLPYVKLGAPLEIEVLSIPEGDASGVFQVELSLKNAEGKILKTFPGISLAANQLADHIFTAPSEEFASEAALIPVLKVTTPDGTISHWEEGMESIRLFPSWNLNYKATKMPLRDILKPQSAEFRVTAGPSANEVQVEGSIVSDEPIMSVEVVQDSRELFAVDPKQELTPRPNEALVMLQWQAMRNPLPFTGTIEVKNGELRKFEDWTRPEYKRSSYQLSTETLADGQKIVPFSTDEGVNSTNARGGFLLITNPDKAVLSMKTNLFQLDLPVKDILASGRMAKVFRGGLTVEASHLKMLPQVPEPLLKKEVSFTSTIHPWRKDAPLQMRVVTESGKIYRSAPVFPFPLPDQQISLPIWSETRDQPVEVSVSESRVPDISATIALREDAMLPVSGSEYFAGLVGGLPFDMGAFAKRYLRSVYPASAPHTAPIWVAEDKTPCLKFDGKGNFLYFPEETLPRGAFSLEFEIKPLASSPQVLLAARGYHRGALTLTLKDGLLNGEWLDRANKVTTLHTGLAVPEGKWSRVQVDFDLTQLRFTVNGETMSIPCSGGSNDSIVPFIFGGYGTGKGLGYFDGYLRALRIRHAPEALSSP